MSVPIRYGEIQECMTVVCGCCGHRVIAYPLAAQFMAEDIARAGWKKTKKRGWICPKCVADPFAAAKLLTKQSVSKDQSKEE